VDNDNLIRKPFESKVLIEDRDDKYEVITVRINKAEREMINKVKKFIQQEKDSTAIKQLMLIGFEIVIQDQKTNRILDIIINNLRRNKRLGISEVEVKD
jgi:hypothetical protein